MYRVYIARHVTFVKNSLYSRSINIVNINAHVIYNVTVICLVRLNTKSGFPVLQYTIGPVFSLFRFKRNEEMCIA